MSSGLHVGALVCGIVGVLAGLIPILFWLAFPLGIIAVVLGVMAYRRARRYGVKQGRSGFILGVIAIVLGVIGFFIVTDAFDELEDDFDCLGEADTSAELDACDEDS